MIEKIKMAQAEAELKQKAQREERRNKNRNNAVITMKDLLTGNMPDDVIAEIQRPDKQMERNRFTKDYMLDFFKRNLTRPTQDMALPSYLKNFQVEDKYDGTHVFKCLKKGTYDIKKEERMLTKLR